MSRNSWVAAAQAGARWSREEAQEALEAWNRSGESLAAFARRHGVVAQRLSWWRKRLAIGVVPRPAPPGLLPVTVREAPLITLSSAAVSVRWGTVRIDVADPSKVPPRWLAALVSSLPGGEE